MSEVILGDCLTEIPKLASESVDLMATDPPYGISFMGNDWDKAVPSVEVWRECFRVMKHGSFAFVMSLPRLDVLSQMSMRLQEGGFRVDFTPLFWAFASGFPKATNISKAVDKKLGIERGREELGHRSSHEWRNKEGRTDLLETIPDGRPVSPEAKALNGSYAGFQPKPAVEVIIVAMKPLSEKTYIKQALKNGKGVTWLDEGRLPFENDNLSRPLNKVKCSSIYGEYEHRGNPNNPSDTLKGRFPANLIVSEDVLNDGQNHDSGYMDSIASTTERRIYGIYADSQEERRVQAVGDSGSFSRFFSLDAWWDKKLQELPAEVRKAFPFLIEPKASKEERNEGLDGMPAKVANPNYGKGGFSRPTDEPERQIAPAKNHHPTVKPLAIMSYLITLGSRRGDTVLDPFAGSGTTVMAAKMLGRKGIGLEINPDYARIAEARVQSIATMEAWIT